MNGSGTLHSSVKQDWQTPDDVLDVVRQVGPIGLDPCTVAENPTGAVCYYTPTADGLAQGWWPFRTGGWIVYVNPPYGRECAAWVHKAIEEAERGTPIVMLVAARPDSRWGQALLRSANALCWWRGRIRFRGAPNAAPFPSLFACWNCTGAFVRAFEPHGVITQRVVS